VSHYRLNTLSRSVVQKTHPSAKPQSFQIKPASQTIHSPSPKTPSSIVITNSAMDDSRIHIYCSTGKPHSRIDQQSNSISKVYSASIYTKDMLHHSPCFMQLRNSQLNIYRGHIFTSSHRAIYKLVHYTTAYLPSLRHISLETTQCDLIPASSKQNK
jgi:hypothetical protein